MCKNASISMDIKSQDLICFAIVVFFQSSKW